MSNLSTVTASVEMDPTLGDDIDVGNWICILVTTCDDCTPLCPSSFKRAGHGWVMHRVGQGHPEGVLQLLDSEVILVFQCKSDMMVRAHHLTVAMVWWGESLMLHILSPKGRQVREYVTKRISCPLGTHMHVGVGKLVSCFSPVYLAWIRAVGGPDIHTLGRTNQGDLGPEWWSTAGSARGSPNQNSSKGGVAPHWGCSVEM